MSKKLEAAKSQKPAKSRDAKKWRIPEWNDRQVYALQALARGEATEYQQKDVLKFIVEKICGTYDETFDLDSERVSAHYQGRRFVGLQIVKLISLNMAAINKEN